jgi:hypothetical protein
LPSLLFRACRQWRADRRGPLFAECALKGFAQLPVF